MEMHETVAEWMIYANHSVAKKLYECYPTSALVSIECHLPYSLLPFVA